jgi:hypothetical protein
VDLPGWLRRCRGRPGRVGPVCGGPADGIEFTLEAGGQSWTKKTQPLGPGNYPANVHFEDVPAGKNLVLVEAIPSGYGTPVVWCTTIYMSDFIRPAVVSGAITFDLAAGDELFCQWFNVPAEDDEPGDDSGDDPSDDPSDEPPVVTTLPDTGTGSAKRAGSGENNPLGIVLGLSVLFAGTAVRRAVAIRRGHRV